MLANPAMDLQNEVTPLALQRLWSLTRARLAGTSTALNEEATLAEILPPAQVLQLMHNTTTDTDSYLYNNKFI